MLVIPICAYGRWHIETAKYLLASLQSEGNLPDVKARVIIYTDEERAFQGYETEPSRSATTSMTKHDINIACYRRALKFGHPIVPLSADMLCPTGLLKALERHAETKRLVVSPVLRCDAAAMLRELALHAAPKEYLGFSPRELMALSMGIIHHRQLGMFWPDLGETNAPTTIFRRFGTTIAARCFHMHPLLVRSSPKVKMTKSLDAGFVDTVSRDEIHIVTDSDETAVVDMTDANYRWETIHSPIGPINDWVRRATNSTHRWFFQHECYLHSEEIGYVPRDNGLEALAEEVLAMDTEPA